MKRLLSVALLLGALGCDPAEVETRAREAGAELADMTVREIGALAGRILDNPEAADSLLAANGLDTEQLDSLMYGIAASAEATAEYLEGLAAR